MAAYLTAEIKGRYESSSAILECPLLLPGTLRNSHRVRHRLFGRGEPIQGVVLVAGDRAAEERVGHLREVARRVVAVVLPFPWVETPAPVTRPELL
jgi:hypothetical protein